MMKLYERRRVIVGAAALTLAGAAVAAEPRRRVVDFTQTHLGDLVPLNVAGWRGSDDANLVPERVDGSLDLGQTITRVYVNPTLPPVMVVVSYHGPGSPDLKVHRPETCYLVAGFTGAEPTPTAVPVSAQRRIAAVKFTAVREKRVETVLYWTRVGNRFPQSLTQQRFDFISQALAGVRSDGLLVRLSAIGSDREAAAIGLITFATAMLRSSTPEGRRLFLGSQGGALTTPANSIT